ncbi:hypothetical protein KIL84_005970 [Mauremys mutica]|uniref:Uncharacterized protein n=1 Tax=Mauremys mutica TaxID=74926 RepID=A0A9D3XIT0_9SAUR|nr:hypothetical protein KIL84_005970 [Mauremys mutica]
MCPVLGYLLLKRQPSCGLSMWLFSMVYWIASPLTEGYNLHPNSVVRPYVCLLGVQLLLSTTYRPQSNSQTERDNQILEQYLQCYFNHICMISPCCYPMWSMQTITQITNLWQLWVPPPFPPTITYDLS